MKSLIVMVIAAVLASCNGNGAGSGAVKTDSVSKRTDSNGRPGIDTSAAALPTDTAPYKRQDSMR